MTDEDLSEALGTIKRVLGHVITEDGSSQAARDAVALVEAHLGELTDALKAATGVLYALPRSAQSKRRSEVLVQCRKALASAQK